MVNLSTVNGGGTTLQPPTGISSFWATNFLFLSVVWWHLCPHSSLSTHWNIFIGHPVLALRYHSQECFQFPIKLIDGPFFLLSSAFWVTCVAFLFSLSNAQARTHLGTRLLPHIAIRLAPPFWCVTLGVPVSSSFSTYQSFILTIISGSFCGRRFHTIPHNHFVESQTSTELASNHNFLFLWKRPNADHRNCVLCRRL